MTTQNDKQQRYYWADPVNDEMIQTWFFAPLLPWQQSTWQYMTGHFPDLPHAILFAGNVGTGKRAFVYRFVAWVLCQNKQPQSACGDCESCQWLLAKTHPNLMILPKPQTVETIEKLKKTKSLTDNSPAHHTSSLIKIENIREIQPFVQQSSHGHRIVVIHQADRMTLGASNALLKTLEEPADNVLMLLLSDTPSQLLPTVRSRLQQFEVSKISTEQAIDFMQQQMPTVNFQDLQQVSFMSSNAPFVAMDMLTSTWYQYRQTWIISWQAIRTGQRSAIQASDYWQDLLSLTDFLYLSQMMLLEIANSIFGLKKLQYDINISKLNPLPSLLSIHTIQKTIEDIWQARQQHIQDKLCYDKLMSQMANS